MTIIINSTQLQNMKNNLADDYELGSNIDCSGIGNFEPVGGWNAQPPFTGTFDGKGYTISNLTANQGIDDYIGLFGKTVGATIQNVTLKDFTLTGGDGVGALVGWNVDTSVSNVKVINVAIIGDWSVGGLIGSNYTTASDKIISNCSSTGSITCVTSWDTGGLLGETYTYAISDCYSEVTVNGDGNVGGLIGQLYSGSLLRCNATGVVNGATYIGGCVGYFRVSGTISRCYATGNVTGTGDVLGGFVGEHGGGTISDCYATGNVEGDDWIGGFAGEGKAIINCYSKGLVTEGIGATHVGGFMGFRGAGVETIACLWDTETSGKATGVGGGEPQGGVTGKTIAEMKAINTILAAGWSIPGIWNRASGCNGGYPCLVGVNSCCPDSAAPPADYTIAPKKVSLELIRNVEIMNAGRFFISKTGNAKYESRFYR